MKLLLILSLGILVGCGTTQSDNGGTMLGLFKKSVVTVPPSKPSDSIWQDRGYRNVKWWAAAALLSKDDRSTLSEITPGIGSWNSTSTWNTTTLRWEEDFFGQPNRKGLIGPHAILPMSEALAAFRDRTFKGMRRISLSALRNFPGFVELPPGASIGKPYGGEKAVWDVYWKPLHGIGDEVVRGHVGGLEDQADSFTSRSLMGVPDAGFNRNDSGSSSSYTAYLVPHDMSEEITEADAALKPYAKYRKQRIADLAKRGPAPHANLDSPQDGYMKITGGKLLRYESGDWKEIGGWLPKPADIPKGLRRAPDHCILQWPKSANSGNLYCFTDGHWENESGLFGIGRTSRNLMETGPLLETWQRDEIRASLKAEGPYSASYATCPIVAEEPWPRAVYDENTIMGTAGNEKEQRDYYGWDKK